MKLTACRSPGEAGYRFYIMSGTQRVSMIGGWNSEIPPAGAQRVPIVGGGSCEISLDGPRRVPLVAGS